MVERGQPWRCITEDCTEGTYDESHRCKQCRKQASELIEASFARYDTTDATPELSDCCDCNHYRDQHAPGGQHCQALDSYQCPCECPSFQPRFDD